ncbi:MAG: ABC transporter substrate-binding protein [Alphaproteobacteria bacterium]|nr:ABC transporter substrate-binding protein [Alphaproteobacteria bacterium]
MDIKIPFKIVSFIVVTTFFSTFLFAAAPPLQTIAITQIADHPAANAVREGILKALKDHGIEENSQYKIIYENAQGNPVTAAQIAQKFVAAKSSVLVPITTTSTQTMVKADSAHALPMVFAAVTDPIAAGVVSSLAHPGSYITGVTDAAPIEEQVKLFKEILPQLQTLGIVYNPGDNSSATPLKQAREAAKKLGVTLIEATAFKTSDVPVAAQNLVGRGVDAIFVPLDNTVLAAMESVLKVANQNKIPVFSSDKDSVEQGALASSGYSHFDTGYVAGEMVVSVLKGANPGDIPVATAKNLNVYINSKTAKHLNLSLPKEILNQAQLM